MAVRALVFDVFGTLVDWRTAVAAAFTENGVPGDPGELADEWRHRFWPLVGEVVNGKREWADFDELHLLTLDALLADRGVEVEADARHRLVGTWHRLDPWPDTRDGLEALRARHVTAALSNGHTALLVDLVRHGDLRFDCLLSSELSRTYKPAREVYESAPRLLGLRPEEVMLVAAHPLDLAGARHAGLRTAFVDRPLEYGPDSPPREDPEADVSAPGLHELAEQLAG
jgi:2-haloacid dehalogenase